MFKFHLPMAILVPASGLLLLAVGSLISISNAAHASESKPIDNQEAKLLQDDDSARPPVTIESSRAEKLNSTRRRSARFFNQEGSSYGSQQQQDSYAAALAAANSGENSSGSADLVQSTMTANDAASFGEQSSAGSPSASTARQFEATDYSPVHSVSGSYYTGTPSATSTSSYLPNHLGHPSSYHAHRSHHSSPSYSHNQPQHHYQSTSPTYNHQQYNTGAASKKVSASLPPLGYPSYDYWSSSPSYFGERSYPPAPYWSSPPHISSGFGSSLMSSASSALSHWTGGFGIAEIICGAIALSIGAVILGAPFFLIYLALMGNFSGSGTLNLTNPTQGAMTTGGPGGSGTTTVNGRRKRMAIFESALGDLDQPDAQFSALADTVIGQLSPFVDLQQVTATFKKLVNSIEKYSKMNQRPKQAMKADAAAPKHSTLRNKT